MEFNSTNQYLKLVNEIITPENVTESLREYAKYISQSELENHFSAPMVWIGMYIVVASLVCILAMVADLLHGFRSRKLWFPCKYFRVNAAFLTVIAVAMKLPVDLTGSMMGAVDKVTKLGSMAFMCIMMANLLPCLATMGSNELLSNMTALCLLVITLLVNVCIQIQTGVLSTIADYDPPITYGHRGPKWSPQIEREILIDMVASIHVIFLGVLLLVHVCTCLAILKSKKIIESKYQQRHETTSKEIQPSPGELLKADKLQNHVTNHWIMAGSGSPQFITACLHTTSASGVICLLVTIVHIYTMSEFIERTFSKDYDSDYGWSMILIFIVQGIGIVIGTIAPLCRCFATLSFKLSSKIISNHFKIEGYWTKKLHDWKHASIKLPFRSRNLEVLIKTLKRLICNLCIGFQNVVVVVCKVIAVIPFLFICVLYCFHCIKLLLKAVFSSLRKKFEKLEGNNEKSKKLEGKDEKSEKLERNNYHPSPYVLQLEDEIELDERTLKALSKSVNRLIQNGANGQPENLMKLIREKSTSEFKGVKNFDHIDDHNVPSVDCWRLPVVTLATIVVSLPNIVKDEVKSLLESVREGLEYVTVVEKSLNAKDDHISFQKAADTLWQEIEFDKRWLGNQDPDLKNKTDRQIVEWFRDKAKNIVYPEERSEDNRGGENDDLIRCFICASSMYRITETILSTCHTNNSDEAVSDEAVKQKGLFNSLVSMIADIIAACLTNLPQTIIAKCHTSVIEEREASVKEAAQLLGETTRIIEILQDRNIPNIDPSDMPFLQKWRAYLRDP